MKTQTEILIQQLEGWLTTLSPQQSREPVLGAISQMAAEACQFTRTINDCLSRKDLAAGLAQSRNLWERAIYADVFAHNPDYVNRWRHQGLSSIQQLKPTSDISTLAREQKIDEISSSHNAELKEIGPVEKFPWHIEELLPLCKGIKNKGDIANGLLIQYRFATGYMHPRYHGKATPHDMMDGDMAQEMMEWTICFALEWCLESVEIFRNGTNG